MTAGLIPPKTSLISEIRAFPQRKNQSFEIACGMAPTPFGTGVFMWTDQGLTALGFADPGEESRVFEDLKNRFPTASLKEDTPKAQLWADACFSASSQSLPLVLYGSVWQGRVWRALLKLKPGETVSYGGLAARLHAPKAARAVGRAVGANPLAWLVPCHRVVGADGRLHGYHWGGERKRAMLAGEGVVV